jgi:hypothetical protein
MVVTPLRVAWEVGTLGAPLLRAQVCQEYARPPTHSTIIHLVLAMPRVT